MYINKTSVSNYDYIEYLVTKIKLLHASKSNYDWYFEELIRLYYPLIQSTSQKVYQKLKNVLTFGELKSRIINLFFIGIIRYDPKYNNDENKDSKDFTYVYFSSYLKKFLPWEVMRISRPSKIEEDDLSIDPRHIELNLNKPTKEISKRLVYDSASEHPISDNFISLCRMTQKETSNDLLSDTMILHYGYDFKNREIAEMLGISQAKVGFLMLELKNFWSQNKELLIP